VDPGERADDDGDTAEEAGLESGVLARRALTVVRVADDDPGDAVVAVPGADGRDRSPLAGDLVLDLVGLAVGVVDSADEAVLKCGEGRQSARVEAHHTQSKRTRTCEMFSRWPRYLSQGPAAEMWSVVHLPLALMRTGQSL